MSTTEPLGLRAQSKDELSSSFPHFKKLSNLFYHIKALQICQENLSSFTGNHIDIYVVLIISPYMATEDKLQKLKYQG